MQDLTHIFSMLDLRIGRSTWLEAYGVDDVKRMAMINSDIRHHYSRELEYLEANSLTAGYGELLWKIKTEAYFRYLEQGLPVLRVDYEELVEPPRSVMREVLKSIGCRWNNAVLKHHTKKDHPEVDRNGLTIGQTDPRRKVSKSSVGRWRKNSKKKKSRRSSTLLAISMNYIPKSKGSDPLLSHKLLDQA